MTIETALTFADHGDWRRAVPAAREALASDPQDPMAHALLALGLAHLEQGPEAVAAGRRAVALAPDLAFAHYAYGWALLEHAEHAAAERAAGEALRLDPGADEHALLAQVHARRHQWRDALDIAERGLAVDPEHPGCGNLRALALANLGRADEAVAGVHDVLALDPDDAYAHANRGWLMLRQSKPKEALDSFSAALRLDPSMDWARAGMIEAIKARSGLYRLMLRYSFWVASMSNRSQWIFIFTVFFGVRIVRAALRANPALLPLLGPLLVVFVMFIFGTWIADPLSNLFLRLHPMGRLALNRSETIASNIVGGALLIAIVASVLGVSFRTLPLMILGMTSGLLLVPIGGAIKAHGTRAWRPLAISVVVLAALGLVAVASSVVKSSLSTVLVGIFAVLTFVYGWTASYLILKYR